MKKYLIFAATALVTLAACTSEDLVDNSIAAGKADNMTEKVMGFNVRNKNMSRAAQAMEDLGLYNFGVYAYKTTDDAGTYETVMNDYLVGYHATRKGYYVDTLPTQPTYGTSSSLTDGISQWFYDGLGKTEYTYEGDEGYYKKSQIGFMSNNDKQYLKFWDYSAKQMEFYAYAPYGAGSIERVDVDGTLHTKVSFGEVTGGTTPANYMVAVPVVRKPGDSSPKYNDDIALTFNCMMGKVRLVFYDDVAGYDVQIDDYTTGVGVQAAPSNIDGEGVVAVGEIVSKIDGVTYDYTDGTTITVKKTKSGDAINFVKPAGASTTAHDRTYNKIQESRPAALATPSSQSPSAYYCVPCEGTVETPVNDGLVFHISFTLYSLDTNEKIQVKNATVTVPAAYTQWTANTLYTYIFKITKNANGSTGGDDDPKGLYPIVFDDIQVADFDTNESEWIISQVSMNKQLITLPSGSTEVEANMNYEDKTGISYTFVWDSSDPAVATVVEKTAATESTMKSVATITAVAAGTANITAKNNGTTATCRVTVPLAITAVGTPSITAGTAGAFTLKANAAASKTVTWECDYTDTTYTPTTKQTTADGEMEFAIPNTANAGDVITVTATYTDATDQVHTASYNVTVAAAD